MLDFFLKSSYMRRFYIRRICGDKMTMMGYVDLIYVIQKGTVEDVRSTVEDACRMGGKDGCFILGTSDSIRENTPMENIDAYFKYGREYGGIRSLSAPQSSGSGGGELCRPIQLSCSLSDFTSENAMITKTASKGRDTAKDAVFNELKACDSNPPVFKSPINIRVRGKAIMARAQKRRCHRAGC